MAEQGPQSQDPNASDIPASPPKDYYSILRSVIGQVSKDRTLLRNLVYALARQNLKPSGAPTRLAEEPWKADSIADYARALELERAITQLEADIAKQPRQLSGPVQTSVGGRVDAAGADITSDSKPASYEPLSRSPLVPLPAESPAWPERRAYLTRVPAWLDPSVSVSLDSVDYVPVEPPQARRGNLGSLLQLVAASVLGVVLYVGISAWVYVGRQSSPGLAPATSPTAQASATAAKELPGQAQTQQVPALEPQPILPFPLPRSYGVYAGGDGKLFPLEQLPIKVPIARVLVSAEITQPSKATVPTKLAFVVYRRDLVASAPQSVAVRVVARVMRSMKFVDGKPTVTPVEASWRIRDKSYEFQVSPLESNREMIVIQPDPEFVFPPGRYALVLNGFGYDFTVAGPVTAPEQCLEQVQVTDGIVVTECPKKS